MSFCDREKIDLLRASTPEILKFLTEMFKNGSGYSMINSAKSALSSFYQLIDNRDIGNNPLVKRFMKGIFINKPSLPKYNKIWDVKIVFDYISTMPDNNELTLKQLSEKLAILFMLFTAQRCQTIHMLQLDDIQITKDEVICVVSNLVKQTKPGLHVQPLEIKKYPVDNKVCLVTTLLHYLERTKDIRQTNNLFISTVPPFNTVTKSTVARWVKVLMKKSGVDIDQFGAHSCRAASTSAAAAKGVPIDTIMKSAGWSSAKTFCRFYKKNVEKTFSESLI